MFDKGFIRACGCRKGAAGACVFSLSEGGGVSADKISEKTLRLEHWWMTGKASMKEQKMLVFGAVALSSIVSLGVPADSFRVRDPFVVTSQEDGLYHLFISDQLSGGVGVSVRTSKDLADWSAPKKVLTLPESWRVVDTWAPEVHRYRDAWYVFVTLGRDIKVDPPMRRLNDDPEFVASRAFEMYAAKLRRGVYVFSSEKLDGPYVPVSTEPLTPMDRVALDGTLWVEDGKPYMVFSWDWPQIMVGECAAVPLKDDLSAFAGEPKTIFRTSDVAPTTIRGIVDGPFVYRSPRSGKLYVFWSTTSIGGDHHRGSKVPTEKRQSGAYRVLACESLSGRIEGPWGNQKVIFADNGGHGMVFRTFGGKDKFAIHHPENQKEQLERAKLFDFVDDGKSLAIVQERPTAPDIGWVGRKVAVLGDSISDPRQPNRIYWQYLGEWLGWNVTSFGVGGAKWCDMPRQINRMEQAIGENVDAILIMMGTNDYQRNRPLGKWYDETSGEVAWRERKVTLARRSFNRDNETVRGSINLAMERLKRRYPRAQIVVLTPIHRAFFQCSDTNIQPAEDWPNVGGAYIDSYVDCIREVGNVWSVPVIDLNAESGLMPLFDEQATYFRSSENDRLHPNSAGHERLAKVILALLLSFPGKF